MVLKGEVVNSLVSIMTISPLMGLNSTIGRIRDLSTFACCHSQMGHKLRCSLDITSSQKGKSVMIQSHKWLTNIVWPIRHNILPCTSFIIIQIIIYSLLFLI